jgi:hypothetical protein
MAAPASSLTIPRIVFDCDADPLAPNPNARMAVHNLSFLVSLARIRFSSGLKLIAPPPYRYPASSNISEVSASSKVLINAVTGKVEIGKKHFSG